MKENYFLADSGIASSFELENEDGTITVTGSVKLRGQSDVPIEPSELESVKSQRRVMSQEKSDAAGKTHSKKVKAIRKELRELGLSNAAINAVLSENSESDS